LQFLLHDGSGYIRWNTDNDDARVIGSSRYSTCAVVDGKSGVGWRRILQNNIESGFGEG
jgi:hypothetical protein